MYTVSLACRGSSVEKIEKLGVQLLFLFSTAVVAKFVMDAWNQDKFQDFKGHWDNSSALIYNKLGVISHV